MAVTLVLLVESAVELVAAGSSLNLVPGVSVTLGEIHEDEAFGLYVEGVVGDSGAVVANHANHLDLSARLLRMERAEARRSADEEWRTSLRERSDNDLRALGLDLEFPRLAAALAHEHRFATETVSKIMDLIEVLAQSHPELEEEIGAIREIVGADILADNRVFDESFGCDQATVGIYPNALGQGGTALDDFAGTSDFLFQPFGSDKDYDFTGFGQPEPGDRRDGGMPDAGTPGAGRNGTPEGSTGKIIEMRGRKPSRGAAPPKSPPEGPRD